MATAAFARFEPPHPPRIATFQPGWRALYGERLRNIVHGLPEPAFDVLHRQTRLLHFRIHLVNDPAMIGHVLQGNPANYPRPPLARAVLRPFIGEGLLTAEGASWKLQRRIVAGAFTPAAVNRMTGLMSEAARAQVDGWPGSSARIDFAAEATRLTMAVIADALFGGDPRLTTPEAGAHIARIIAATAQARPLTLLGLSHLDPSPGQVAVRRSGRWLRARIGGLVDDPARGDADDFFAGLLRALRHEYPRDTADALALDNALTFFVAGHETSATALAWSAYLLAAQPALQELLREEAVAALAGPIWALIDRLPLLRQFLDETMRLYPPLAQISRQALADDEIAGMTGAAVRVRKGDLLLIYPWLVHRHRKLWDDPDAFDFARFSPERRPSQHRFQYLPFGAGPRICVGLRFAQVEMLVILAHWLAARRFALPEGAAPLPYGTVTLRPRGGMMLDIQPLVVPS